LLRATNETTVREREQNGDCVGGVCVGHVRVSIVEKEIMRAVIQRNNYFHKATQSGDQYWQWETWRGVYALVL
jgi:hypothetical protein